MVLETTWMTRTGWLVVYDFLAIGPWHHEEERELKHQRAPADYEAEDCMVRIAACVQGLIDLNLECAPQFDYADKRAAGSTPATATARPLRARMAASSSSRWTARCGWASRGGSLPRATTLRDNQSAYAALSWSSSRRGPESVEEAYEWMQRTANFWREWLNQGTFPRPSLAQLPRAQRDDAEGAVVHADWRGDRGSDHVAATRAGGERNWDSRYVFLRDAAFTLWALYSLDFDWEADDFFYFLADQAGEDGSLQNIYSVTGDTELQESTLDHLAGYDGARPVRVGNAAYEYKQHDVWGAVLDAAYLHARSRDKLPERVWPIVRKQVETAAENWKEKDRGIWALRGDPQHYTSSKVMCWCACDRGARLAELRDELDLAKHWQDVADEIREDVLANALDDRGVLHDALRDVGARRVRAAPAARALPAAGRLPDPQHGLRDLRRTGRERGGSAPPSAQRSAGARDRGGEAFIACSFWLVSAFAEIGEHDRARALCERMLAHARPARPVRRASRSVQRPAPGQLPERVHGTRADQRGAAHHPNRPAPADEPGVLATCALDGLRQSRRWPRLRSPRLRLSRRSPSIP